MLAELQLYLMWDLNMQKCPNELWKYCVQLSCIEKGVKL